MRLGFLGDGPWAHLALIRLLEDDGFDVAFVAPRAVAPDHYLENIARNSGVDIVREVSVNDSNFIRNVRELEIEILVSMSFDQIFRKDILGACPIINCHAGKLPFYRGRNVVNWALINGEKEIGVTVHHVDEGIDTGDIIAQTTLPVGECDTYSSVLEKLYPMCSDLLVQALRSIKNKSSVRIEQKLIHPTGSYCSRRKPGDEIIDWNLSSAEIFNFVRALNGPDLCAATYVEQKLVEIRCVKFFDGSHRYQVAPGTILSRTKDGFLVKTGDSVLEIVSQEDRIIVGKRFESGIE